MNALLACGALTAFFGVGLGAFGAHGLQRRITEDRLKTFQTGVQYQLVHALAMLAAGIVGERAGASFLVAAAGWLFFGGVILFSGSLYGLAAGRLAGKWGLVTPVGGLLFLTGWALLTIGVLTAPPR